MAAGFFSVEAAKVQATKRSLVRARGQVTGLADHLAPVEEVHSDTLSACAESSIDLRLEHQGRLQGDPRSDDVGGDYV